MSSLLSGTALPLALGSSLVTGIFFAFSSFIMRALAQTSSGAEAMQRINVVILRSSFMPLFMGLTALSLIIVVATFVIGPSPASPWLLAGGLLYLIGVFGVTVVFNVPLNTRLAAAEGTALEGIWSHYSSIWTLWNTVRTVAGVGSSLSFIVAFRAL